MVFDENSGLVRVWVGLLNKENSPYTIDSVPNIGNLRDVVSSLYTPKESSETVTE